MGFWLCLGVERAEASAAPRDDGSCFSGVEVVAGLRGCRAGFPPSASAPEKQLPADGAIGEAVDPQIGRTG